VAQRFPASTVARSQSVSFTSSLWCFDLILHAVTFPFDDHGLSVVQEAVQHGIGQGAVVVENFGPAFIGLQGSINCFAHAFFIHLTLGVRGLIDLVAGVGNSVVFINKGRPPESFKKSQTVQCLETQSHAI
jgi:hypothetical protein